MKVTMNKFDFMWVMNLFGTAVGAGVLFLPINAGIGGVFPLLVMIILIGPMIFLAHCRLSQFVASSQHQGRDITEVVEEHFGKLAGALITGLYFFSIFPSLLIYSVGITNTVESFITEQLHMPLPPRVVTSFVILVILVGLMLMREKTILKITQWLVYPLIIFLFIIALYLVPSWQLSAFSLNQLPDTNAFIGTVWLTVPVLVFTFNHSSAISTFTLSQQHQYKTPALTAKHIRRTLFMTTCVLLVFVMFFVFSCVMTLSPEALIEAKKENISILSFIANRFDNPYISIAGPFVSFVAIASSFFGNYLGAREGMIGIIIKFRNEISENSVHVDKEKLNYVCAAVFFVILWYVAIIKPSVINLIELFGGPIIALILFIMPIYAVYTVPAMQHYRNTVVSNVFVIFMGLISVSSLVYKLFFE